MGGSRKHHYIPACYLAGFTKDWSRDSSFWCIPKNNSKPFGTNPNDACTHRDYYTVEELSDDPLFIEEWYARTIEDDIGKILQHIRNHKTLPTRDNMEPLLLLGNPSLTH